MMMMIRGEEEVIVNVRRVFLWSCNWITSKLRYLMLRRAIEGHIIITNQYSRQTSCKKEEREGQSKAYAISSFPALLFARKKIIV